jgi:TRAP transporter TAXI family solute receptor
MNSEDRTEFGGRSWPPLSELVRSRVGIAAIILLAASALFALDVVLRPFPGRTLVMATGPQGSTYAVMAERYRTALARNGVELKVRFTSGAVENVKLLNDPRSGVDVAFAQAGITNEGASPQLVSLGTVFYEALWFFCRCEATGRGLGDLNGSRISIGQEGSGTRSLSLRLLELNSVDPGRLTLEGFPPAEAARRLRAGDLDGAAILTGWESPVVRSLLADPTVSLLTFARADAYVALIPYLRKVKIPQGVGNLAANRPASDVYLLATKASLLIRRQLHPAYQYLLLHAAQELHARADIFSSANEFPAPETMDVPVSDEAQSFYKSGPNFLQRYLPFWLAALTQRALLLLIPVIGIVYPLTALLPKLYRWEMRRRILPFYGILRRLERRARAARSVQEQTELLAALDSLERKASEISVSTGYSEMLYAFKVNVRYVRAMLQSTH